MLLTSFIIFLLLILSIGLYAKRYSKNTTDDYVLASRSIPVWQTVFSALASAFSGFMYIGLIGYTYNKGLSGIWLMTFWVVGEYFAMRYIPRKINHATERKNLKDFNDLLSNYWGQNHTRIKKLAAIITLIFLSVYASAQFQAAGKAIHAILEWDISVGIILSYIMVVAYCFAGGIRASIWTDNVQFIIMLVAIIILVFWSLDAIGGWSLFIQKLHQNPVTYTQFFPESMGDNFFILLFFLGWVAGGLGVTGQPHVAVRFMSMQNTQAYKKIVYSYYAFAVSFSALCILSALLAKVYFANTLSADFDPETVLPMLAIAILPPVLVALMLSAILSAIISTADSQILSASSALSNTLLKQQTDDQSQLRRNKFATILIASFALLMALYGDNSVFSLVVIAWFGLASSFTPLLLLQFMGYKIPQNIGIVIMLSGLSAAVIWRVSGLHSITYEALIGISTGFVVFAIAHLFTPIEKQTISE